MTAKKPKQAAKALFYNMPMQYLLVFELKHEYLDAAVSSQKSSLCVQYQTKNTTIPFWYSICLKILSFVVSVEELIIS